MKIQYLDLDLVKSQGGSTGTMEKGAEDRRTKYADIDWLKTQALTTNTTQAAGTVRKFSDRLSDN